MQWEKSQYLLYYNNEPVIRDHVKSSLCNYKGISFMSNRYHISNFWMPNLSMFFNMCYLAVNFECSVTFVLVIQFQIHNGRHFVSRICCKASFPIANLFVWIDIFFYSNIKGIKGRTLCFSTKKSAVRVIL